MMNQQFSAAFSGAWVQVCGGLGICDRKNRHGRGHMFSNTQDTGLGCLWPARGGGGWSRTWERGFADPLSILPYSRDQLCVCVTGELGAGGR